VKVGAYIVVWGILVAATVLELFLFGLSAAPTMTTTAIVSLAGMKATLIALIYQHLVREPRSLAVLYMAALVAGVGLIIAMLVSM